MGRQFFDPAFGMSLCWLKMTVADKVEGTRVMLLTPFLGELLGPHPKTGDSSSPLRREQMMYPTHLREVGGSVMLAVPPAFLDKLHQGLGASVVIAIDRTASSPAQDSTFMPRSMDCLFFQNFDHGSAC